MSLELPITDYIDFSLNTIPSQANIREVGQKMVELGTDSILVVENGVISGIVTKEDITKAIFKETDVSAAVKSIASKPLITIANTADVEQAIKMMKKHNIRRLVVTDDSAPVGIITQKKIFGNISNKAIEIPELEIPTKIKCPYCSSLFEKKEELSRHIDQVHIGYGVFQGNSSRSEELGSISSPDTYSKSL